MPPRRSRAKGAPKSKPGTVIIAEHMSNWSLQGGYARTRDGYKSLWACTVCGKPFDHESTRQTAPPAEFHPAVKAK